MHLYGHPADMDAINHIAAVHGLWVVEDAAEAHLATYNGRPVGGLADVATFSFYGNKILTCGEGGALTLNDRQLELRLRTLRGQGMNTERRYYFPVTGYNFRLTNVACALLCAQLERKDAIVEARGPIFRAYKELLGGIPGIGFQPVANWAVPAPWLFCMTVDKAEYGCSRDELMHILSERGIDIRPFFLPLHKLPLPGESRKRGECLPYTDALSDSGMNLPTYSALRDAQIEQICEIIRQSRK